jgi:hypothetical protein
MVNTLDKIDELSVSKKAVDPLSEYGYWKPRHHSTILDKSNCSVVPRLTAEIQYQIVHNSVGTEELTSWSKWYWKRHVT